MIHTVIFFLLCCLINLSAQKVVFEHDFFSGKMPEKALANGTISPEGYLVCEKGYSSFSAPVTVKRAILVEITAAAKDRPVNLSVIFNHILQDGREGTLQVVASPLVLSGEQRTYTYYVDDPSFTEPGKDCSLALYRINSQTGAYGAEETVNLRKVRIREAEDADRKRYAEYATLPVEQSLAEPLPRAISVFGRLENDHGSTVKINEEAYVAMILKVKCDAWQDLIVEIEAKTTGHPASTLGAFLYRYEGERLVTLSRAGDWHTPLKKDSYDSVSFLFNGALFKQSGNFVIYIYRSNQQGTLFIKKLNIRQENQGKTIRFFYRNTPDLIGPLQSGPSGVPDFHIGISGVDPEKQIREITVENDSGGRWVSGDDVKKNYWMIQYYDPLDFPSGVNPKNNFDGAVHSGLSSLDLVFESTGSEPVGVQYRCTVEYTDGTTEQWDILPVQAPIPDIPVVFNHLENRIVARRDFQYPAQWHQLPIGERSFWHLMSPREELAKGTTMKGKTLRRIWSPAWFFPLTERNPNPSPETMKRYGIPYHARLALREFQVFDSHGREISRQAKVTAECAQGVLSMDAVNDGDLSPAKAFCSAEPLFDTQQTGSVTLDFGEKMNLGKTILHHGMRNGSAIAWTAKNFTLEYWNGAEWEKVSSGAISGNLQEETEHDLSGIVSSKLRLTIQDQNGLYDYGKFNFDIQNPLLNIADTSRIPADIPFHYWYLGHDLAIHFGLPDSMTYDKKAYAKWRGEHPNFLGFQIAEHDNDLATFLGWDRAWNSGSMQKNLDYASRKLVIHQEPPSSPASREEALIQYEQLFKRYRSLLFDEISNFCSLSIWHHYGLEWGAVNTVLENGGGGSPTLAMQNASARGAVRQFGNKPWGFYQATFVGNGYLNYLEKGKGGAYYYGPDCGKSASLYRRQLFLAYLMGVSFIDYEHPELVFCKEKPQQGKMPELSPHGYAALELYEFDRKHPERGTPYVPIALLLDWTHGWRHSETTKVFMGNFEPTAGDRNIDVWMKGIFGINQNAREGYGFHMSMTGFSGLVDILVFNPPSGTAKTLNAYKAVILAGDIRFTAASAEALKSYVHNGGTLLINAAQLNGYFGSDFTGMEISFALKKGTRTYDAQTKQELSGKELPYEYYESTQNGAAPLLVGAEGETLASIHPYGNGNVIVTLQKYLMEEPWNASQKEGLPVIRYLLSLLRHETLPMEVRGNRPAELVMNRLPGKSWRLSLLNNQGVYKQGNSPPSVDKSEIAQQTVIFRGKLESARELISGKELILTEQKGNSMLEIAVPPGDLVIIDLKE